VIGLGVGQKHAAAYQNHPACELVAVCDVDEEKLAGAKALYPAVRLTKRADELYGDPSIDIISVASYDNFHCSQVVAALRHGKHVFVEKPLCVNEHELEQIRAELQVRPNQRLSSNLVLRTAPRFAYLKRIIGEGRLGRLFYAEGDYLYGRLHKITEGWRGKLDFYSVVYGGTIHLVDLLLWLTGDRVVEVSAFGNRIASADSEFKYNDMVAALLRFESGLVAKVGANFGCVFPHFHNVSIYGTEGTFVNGRKEAWLYSSRTPEAQPEQVLHEYPGRSKEELLHAFIDSLVGRANLDCVSSEDVFRSMSVCLAIEKAAQLRTTVQVRYV
jgi:predicted dehydrogenase